MDIAILILVLISALFFIIPSFFLLIIFTEAATRYILSITLFRPESLESDLYHLDHNSGENYLSPFNATVPGTYRGRRKHGRPAPAEEGTTADGDLGRCVFCLYEVEMEDEVRELRCGHVFHRACLDRWVEHGSMTCPLCRSLLSAAEEEEEEEQEVVVRLGLPEVLFVDCLAGR